MNVKMTLVDPERAFIEWLMWGPHPFVARVDAIDEEIVYYFTDELDPKRWTLDELYDYWQNGC